jgi:hypothetical protein
MLQKIQLEKVLFLDIETVPQVYQFDDVDETTAKLFDQKTKDTKLEKTKQSELSIFCVFGFRKNTEYSFR